MTFVQMFQLTRYGKMYPGMIVQTTGGVGVAKKILSKFTI